MNLEDWDQFFEDMPDVFGLIGPAAFPTLVTFLADASHALYARSIAARSLGIIGRMYPEMRARTVQTLTDHLTARAESDVDFNTFLISPLLDLEAVESLPVIKAVYDAEAVDFAMYGDYEDVEIIFGARTERDTPRPRYRLLPFDLPDLLGRDVPEETTTHRRNADKKAKNKKKMADKSRRQNRKKK